MKACAKATRLLSDANHRELSSMERFWLRYHTLVCGACRRYQKQLALIRSILRSTDLEQDLARNDDKGMSAPLRTRLDSLVQKFLTENH